VVPRFVFVGERFGLNVFFAVRARSPLSKTRQVLLNSGAHVKDPRAKRTQEPFVPGAREKIARKRPHVDRQMTGGLRGVDEKQGSRFAGDISHSGHGLNRACNV